MKKMKNPMAQKDVEKLQNRQRAMSHTQTDGIEVTFYTDPLCCWSWVMEPEWRKLQEKFGTAMSVSYKMAGLLPSWHNFTDSLNSIRNPGQMGPEWMHAKAISGVDIDPGIWLSDPPASSFPACIGVKCAGLQSKEAEDKYLYLLRESVMVNKENIARTDVLLQLAGLLSTSLSSFDLFTFREDLLGERGKNAFRIDWQEAKYKGITRLPTLIFRSAVGPPVLLSGFQNYDTMEQTVLTLGLSAPIKI